MSAKVVRSEAVCCPAANANRAAYSASPALASHDAWDDRGKDVNGSIDSCGVVPISEEEYSASDGSGVGATQIGGVGEYMQCHFMIVARVVK